MNDGIRAAALAASLLTAGAYVIHADVGPSSKSGGIHLQQGNQFLAEGRYLDALAAFERAVGAVGPADLRAARTGLVMAALRCAEFQQARTEAEKLVASNPKSPDAVALFADTLWGSGLFQEAESRYRDALAEAPDLARGHRGLARALAARTRLQEGMDEAQVAVRLGPRDLDVHHTVGAIYERMHKYEAAAAAFTNYVNLLPNKDHSAKAKWSRSEIKLLRSFGQRIPFEVDPSTAASVYTVDFRLVKDKMIVRARVNGGSWQDFIIDTGAESTVLSQYTAQQLNVLPVAYTLSAGVGDAGISGLQLARISTLELGNLKLRNVPCLIADRPPRDLPFKEADSLSPLSLGFSMVIDYKTHKITFGHHLPHESADIELPLRVDRLATVRGTIDGTHAANFVVDTGGQVISISRATAATLGRPEPKRRIALKVFGSSGWDTTAFLMLGLNLSFDTIRYTDFPVVVLNLSMPSALIGFELGGIVGHAFLSRYRVGIDLENSVLRLKKL